ncbi:hypothetical protein TNIN_473901, partial [Trichonephila inaurata madagascariensis]
MDFQRDSKRERGGWGISKVNIDQRALCAAAELDGAWGEKQ